jgi:acyl-CoA thioesterase II
VRSTIDYSAIHDYSSVRPYRGGALTDLAEVVRLLDIEQLDADLFRGFHPAARPPRVFGGQVLAQGLCAAGRTISDSNGLSERLPHSLHGYFIRPGHCRTPIIYKIARLRDGGSMSVRRVSAVQDDEVICEITCSFAEPREPVPSRWEAPLVQAPDDLPDTAGCLAAYAGELDGWWVRERPFDMRPLDPPPRAALDELDGTALRDPSSRLWLRADGPVPDNPLLQTSLLAYVSDMTLLEPVLVARRTTTLGPGSVASLDHAMWFHRTPDLTDWHLYDKRMVGEAARRGLASGRLFNRAGDLVATVNQEGYLSPHDPRHWAGPRLQTTHPTTTD